MRAEDLERGQLIERAERERSKSLPAGVRLERVVLRATAHAAAPPPQVFIPHAAGAAAHGAEAVEHATTSAS